MSSQIHLIRTKQDESAFPEQLLIEANGEVTRSSYHSAELGLTRLEWMAGQALAGGHPPEAAVAIAVRTFEELNILIGRARHAPQDSPIV